VKRRIPAAAFFAVAACAAQPQQDDFDGKPWEVQKTQLPSYPKPENLLRVHVSPPTSFEFFVDTASVSVGQDGIVRYTLIARSTGGAVNVSYEGIRCLPLERKLYAFGGFDRTWSPARVPQWAPISRTQTNQQHAALAEDFFCPESGRVRTTEEAVQALRRGNIPGLGR
jgi:hypothetical protein